MRAKKAEIAVWRSGDLDVDARELGLDGSPTRVVRIFAPEPRPGGRVIQGTVDEVVAELAAELVPAIKGS
jgi:electron transfer flavoprotein beta subunit